MFNRPNSKPKFFEMEQEILKFWKDKDILNKSINQRPEDFTKTFYDGPITANGQPHHGHMLTFAMKDIIPRYWTMKGYRVDRSLGWDCQGIPVEYEVEKKLKFKEKKDIEKFGIAKFNQLCRESVMVFKDKIVELEELMGRLTNSDEEYMTMDKDYIESVWWSLSELYKKGHLYEGFKVVPYSTRAGTTLSNAEVALGGYKKMIDPAITVKFPLKDDPTTMLLAWTTTPWTMPGNLGLAVGKEIKYVKVKSEDNTYIVAKDLVESVFKEQAHEIVGEITAAELIGKEYLPPFDYYKGRKNVHKIYEASHVTTDSGTGIVHLAPYGAEDNEIFQKVGIDSFDYLDDQGDFKSDIPEYAGLNYRDANPKIIEALKEKNVLFKYEDYEHEMPMCWRTNTPLIYKPITSWYIDMSNLRSELVANNEKINWTPDHVKNGRFGNWLAEIKDWGISRSRYWGTPLPVWKSESGKVIVIGSFEELKKLSGKDLEDPHKPFVDEISFVKDGETYKRIPDVIDVWYDSGAMPFARLHYPFENKDKFEKKFPAQYIAESVDQTRGWFYSLHAISTSLFGKEAFENVVMSGFVLDDNGVKLSKSKGNYTEPNKMLAEFGADSIRANFFSTPICQGEDTTISNKTLRIITQEYLLPLWNTYTYLVTYANIHNWEPRAELVYYKRINSDDSHPWDHMPFDNITNEMDSWILLRLQNTIHDTTTYLDSYQFPKAIKSIKSLIEDVSKWYIRLNRDRFVEGQTSTLDILYYVFIEIAKLLAPLTPFLAEKFYQELVVSKVTGVPESIHLTDYPEADLKFIEEYSALENEMEFVRKICELGNTIRTTAGIKVRQPLAAVYIQNTNKDVPSLSSWMQEIIMRELNVKELEEKANVQSPNSAEDTGMGLVVALNTELTEELKSEGIFREFTRSVQAQRKNIGLNPEDYIKLIVGSNEEFRTLLSKNEAKVKETLKAKEIELLDSVEGTETEIEQYKFTIKITKI